MSTSALPYQLWIDQALREVIRQALMHAGKFGLPEHHHFYITFQTGAEGVEVSPRVRAQHADEMTIVLQYQFWDLVVDEDAFSVTLKFGGKRDRLRVPFQALTAFADPGVNFALQFKQVPAAGAETSAETGSETGSETAQAPEGGQAAAAKPAKGARKPGSVIPLDTFRKK